MQAVLAADPHDDVADDCMCAQYCHTWQEQLLAHAAAQDAMDALKGEIKSLSPRTRVLFTFNGNRAADEGVEHV